MTWLTVYYTVLLTRRGQWSWIIVFYYCQRLTHSKHVSLCSSGCCEVSSYPWKRQLNYACVNLIDSQPKGVHCRRFLSDIDVGGVHRRRSESETTAATTPSGFVLGFCFVFTTNKQKCVRLRTVPEQPKPWTHVVTHLRSLQHRFPSS